MGAGTGAGALIVVDAVVAVDVDAGSSTDDGVDEADLTWHGMTASIAEGAPEGGTPAIGPGRGGRTVEGEGLVEAGVDAVVSAGVEAVVDADVGTNVDAAVGAGVRADGDSGICAGGGACVCAATGSADVRVGDNADIDSAVHAGGP